MTTDLIQLEAIANKGFLRRTLEFLLHLPQMCTSNPLNTTDKVRNCYSYKRRMFRIDCNLRQRRLCQIKLKAKKSFCVPYHKKRIERVWALILWRLRRVVLRRYSLTRTYFQRQGAWRWYRGWSRQHRR